MAALPASHISHQTIVARTKFLSVIWLTGGARSEQVRQFNGNELELVGRWSPPTVSAYWPQFLWSTRLGATLVSVVTPKTSVLMHLRVPPPATSKPHAPRQGYTSPE